MPSLVRASACLTRLSPAPPSALNPAWSGWVKPASWQAAMMSSSRVPRAAPVAERHLVGHGSRQWGDLVDRDARTHADATRTHPANQPVDDEPSSGAGRPI